MCELLGANMDPLDRNFNLSIKSLYDGSIIYIILDASHMEKLLRNLLGNHAVMFDEINEKIEWSYFNEPYELSKNANLCTHKLPNKHTSGFKRNKMNVRLAVETFSTSTADAFKMMRDKRHQKFVNSLPTENFTRIAERIRENIRHSNIYKRPKNEDNKREILEFIKIYLKGLKLRKKKGIQRTEKVSVLNTINKTTSY